MDPINAHHVQSLNPCQCEPCTAYRRANRAAKAAAREAKEVRERNRAYDERMRYHGGSPETARFTEEVPPVTDPKPGRHRFEVDKP